LEIAGKSPLSHAAPLVCDFHGNYLQIMQRVLQQLTNCTYSPPTSAIQLAHSDDDDDDVDVDVDGKCLQCKCLTIICTVSNHFGACAK